jgi:hypothetical protein
MINLETLNILIFILKIIIFLLTFIFLSLSIYLLLKTDWLARIFLIDFIEFLKFRPYERPRASKKWKKIIKRLETGTESEIKLAIIEADDLFNEILKRMGYEGETLGEKLKRVKKTILPNLDEVFQVHKIKSDIVYDPSFRLTLEQAKKILGIYERALSNLEAI